MGRRHLLASTLLIVGLVAGLMGCSSDTNPTAQPPPGQPATIDLSGVKDDPFCQSAADTVRALYAAGAETDPAIAPTRLTEMKAAYQRMTEQAPSELKDQLAVANQAVQGHKTIADILFQPPEVVAANDSLKAWTAANCNLDVDKVG